MPFGLLLPRFLREKLKILMVAPGASIHALRQLDWLLDSGCTVCFVARSDPFPDGREKYTYVPHPFARGVRLLERVVGKAWARRLVAYLAALQFWFIWKIARPDVVHVHEVDEKAYFAAISGLRPLILTVWGTDVNRLVTGHADDYKRKIVGDALRAADLVIVDAKDMEEKVVALSGTSRPIELMPLGINTNRFTPQTPRVREAWRQRLNIPQDAAVFYSVRAWAPRYGHHLVLEAFARALPRMTRQGILLFKVFYPNPDESAETESYRSALLERADKLGISHAVRWIGETEPGDLPAVYALSDVVVNFPSMDAFPVTFMEAAACMRSVITCRLRSYEGTFAERLFLMVESGNIGELAHAMVNTVNSSPEASMERLEEARRVVEEQYAEGITVSRLLSLYQEVLKTPEPAQHQPSGESLTANESAL